MQSQNIKVMAVDDDDINLEILVKNLKDSGYDTIAHTNGESAWNQMIETPDCVDIILLDKMMPRMNGIQILSEMQKHPMLKNIPVIMQTGDVGVKEVKEGMELGAYYYLCKPFDPGVMIAMVNAATRDFIHRDTLYQKLKHETALSDMISEGKFTFKTIHGATRLANALANNAEQPDRIKTALLELMVNAVEHGNLGINYEEKGRLLINSSLDKDIERRLKLPENKDKYVEVFVTSNEREVKISICDQGPGFRWNKFIDFDPLRLTDPNGRGIATAKLMGTKVEYTEPGNKVTCTFKKAN